MPKAKFGSRRSNPFELKLFEAQDQCDIRAHTKFQLPKCWWSQMTMGQSRGILCGERVFVHLKLKLKVKINAHGGKKNRTQPERCVWSFSLCQASSYEADFQEQWSLLVAKTFSSFPWPNPLNPSCVPIFWWLMARNTRFGRCYNRRLRL